MSLARLWIRGAGIRTDGYAGMAELAPGLPARSANADEGFGGQDALTQSALLALDEAMTMAGAEGGGGDSMALLFVTAWGMIDSTAAYLESMLEGGGRFASPRHFTRSVYSAAASALAIHFGIHGQCQTLAFDLEEDAVGGALAQAGRLLAAGRAESVAVVWADQAGALAEDLSRRAAERLNRHEFDRWRESGLGQGAVAVVVGAQGPGKAVEMPVGDFATEIRGKGFPMDSAVRFLAGVFAR